MNRIRLLLVVLTVSAGIGLFAANYAALSEDEATFPPEVGTQVAEPTTGPTVVSSHWDRDGWLLVVGADGRVAYRDTSHDGYWDVDPVPGRDALIYSTTDEIGPSESCTPRASAEACVRQSIEYLDLSTGETEVLYSEVAPQYDSSEWHDVDRINESHYLVGDMAHDDVFVVDTDSGLTTWRWRTQSAFPLSSGGSYPYDWAHLNDVERLSDGRTMVSLRNQDQVVFVHPERGIQRNWTLGADGDHDVLFEQHNPDYIDSAGAPSVLVADSENDRIVEYRRADGEWRQTWEWYDGRLQWPRDADRLPNGRTLVTDTHGGRVIEVNESGGVVWTLDVPVAYEAERLGTGAESTGGENATALGLTSRRERFGGGDATEGVLKTVLPNKWVNGVRAGTPLWFGALDGVLVLVGVLSFLGLVVDTVRRSPYELRSPVARR